MPGMPWRARKVLQVELNYERLKDLELSPNLDLGKELLPSEMIEFKIPIAEYGCAEFFVECLTIELKVKKISIAACEYYFLNCAYLEFGRRF